MRDEMCHFRKIVLKHNDLRIGTASILTVSLPGLRPQVNEALSELLCNNSSLLLQASAQILDVRRKGWIGVDALAQLRSGDAMFDGKSEQVDQFFAGMSDKMCAEDTVGRLVYHDFRPRHCLCIGAGGEPGEHVGGMNNGVKALLFRCGPLLLLYRLGVAQFGSRSRCDTALRMWGARSKL